MKFDINPYIESFGWITDPPDPDAVDDALLEASGLDPAEIAADFHVLITATAAAHSGEPHLLVDGQIRNLERYIAGSLREGVASSIVNVASTYPASSVVDDVVLGEEARAFWHSGILIDLLADVLADPVRRAGHHIGCVQVYYDAASNRIETSARLVRRGQCSLEVSVRQPLVCSPAWLDQLQDATAAASVVSEDPSAAPPALPDHTVEVGELAAALAAALASGQQSFPASGTVVAAELTRTELAAAMNTPIAAFEVVYTGTQGTLLIWEPQAQLPHSLLLTS